MCYARSSIRSTIDRYKKACSDDSNSGTVTEINAQESAKLRQQIQMLQNSNRSLSNWRTGLSEASLGSDSRNRKVLASKHGDWARAECNLLRKLMLQ
ncbi:hypothetical protein CUMW_267490 [Citrus unshiu]|uniref:Uncharacterized protein n=1 Tax=Citrus unshiu TaxID=55188 RepID=A0A2H5QW68_CITUN|nr:hypothetical protein CUMW_267490 [Citrus unshiu]